MACSFDRFECDVDARRFGRVPQDLAVPVRHDRVVATVHEQQRPITELGNRVAGR